MQHRPSPIYFACLAPALLLSACASPDGEFPSLERRPYETSDPLAVPATEAPAAPVRLSAELAAKVDALTRRHEAASAAFNERLAAVQAIAANAANTSTGTEAWVNAHLQLSRLDKLRADSVAALGELDALISREIDGGSDQVPLLVERQLEIAAQVAAQREQIGRMSQQIGE